MNGHPKNLGGVEIIDPALIEKVSPREIYLAVERASSELKKDVWYASEKIGYSIWDKGAVQMVKFIEVVE